MCFSYGGLHNGHCAKWECDTGTTTTSGRCEGQYYGCDKVTVNLSYQRQGQSHTEDILASFINTETLQFTLGGRTFEMQCGSKSNFQQNPTATYGSTGMGCMWEGEFDDNLNALGISNFHIHSVKCSASSCNAGKTESSCKSQSSTCTRKPGSSSTTTGYKCIRQDGQPATAADCDPTWAKPSCGDNQQYHCIERVSKCIRKPEYNNWNSSQRFRPMPGCYCNNGRQAPFDECAKVNKDPSCQYGFMQSGYPLPLYNCQQTPSVAPKCLWVCDHAINNCDNRYCEQVSLPTLEECSSYNTQLTCNQDAGCSRVKK